MLHLCAIFFSVIIRNCVLFTFILSLYCWLLDFSSWLFRDSYRNLIPTYLLSTLDHTIFAMRLIFSMLNCCTIFSISIFTLCSTMAFPSFIFIIAFSISPFMIEGLFIFTYMPMFLSWVKGTFGQLGESGA